jgi:thymidylate synthase
VHAGPTPILTAKVNALHEEVEQARKTFSHSTQTAKNKTAKEELLTKEFFSTFKSRTNNGDIAELYTTDTWDAPEHNENKTTDSDNLILKELRKY